MSDSPIPQMTAIDVLSLYTQLELHGVRIWFDGGWSVDATLGHQTRPHQDVDIIIQEKDLAGLHNLLEPQGYKNVLKDDTRQWNYVLGDESGHLVDIHVIVFDKDGNGIYGPVENRVMYPADALTGSGIINGIEVRCLTPEYMVQSRTGYSPRKCDRLDVAALYERFGIKKPIGY